MTGVQMRWFTAESIAAVALLLSLSVAGVNAWQALRGPDITIAVRPTRVLLYRDGSDDDRTAVPSMAVRIPLVNRAGQDYGDVVTKVTATLTHPGERGSATFESRSIVRPIPTAGGSEVTNLPCPAETRCVRVRRLLLVEREGGLVDLPGGAARDQYFGFWLNSAYCMPSSSPACRRFASYGAALAELTRQPTTIRFTVSFSSDREEVAVCTIQLPANDNYFRQSGYRSLRCR